MGFICIPVQANTPPPYLQDREIWNTSWVFDIETAVNFFRQENGIVVTEIHMGDRI